MSSALTAIFGRRLMTKKQVDRVKTDSAGG
jgi:hypothetical protein